MKVMPRATIGWHVPERSEGRGVPANHALRGAQGRATERDPRSTNSWWGSLHSTHPTVSARPALLLLVIVMAGGNVLPAAAGVKLDVYPREIHLQGASAQQRFVVVATRADGVTEDVTARAKATLADGKRARLEGNLVRPVGDGHTTLTVEYGGQSAPVPIAVAAAAATRGVSFKLDVMPIFMRAGCNTGSCHGSARGKDGFRLSLFGFDPDGDYFRLTREISGRRINLALPAESLLLEKATGAVPHTGGKRFPADSPYYQTLLQWLETGAAADAGEVPKVERVELYPPQMVLEGKGVPQQMVVRATYADGSQRDVTPLALYLSNNDNSAGINAEGLVTSANPGEAFVMARFSTHTVGSQVIVLPAGASYTPPDEKPVNYIDELVGAKLRKLRIRPAGLCSDEIFLRRVSLDIAGRIPSDDEYRRFIGDRAADKRARLIDRLLERKEFSEIWAMNWAELLMVHTTLDMSYKSVFLYSNWLTEQIAHNVPIDRMARELLTASGGTFSNPPTNFYQVEKDTLKTAENVAQVFMGIRVQCAQCHNHPFDRWTLDDYYSFAAFFAQIGRKQGEDYRETIVFDRQGGEVRHPVRGGAMPPKLLGGPQPDVQGKDRRAVLAAWLTSPDNPFFARSIANRIWAYFFGQGIVEPVDDFRVSNPPSNPELLAELARRFVEYHYDFRRLVRDICNSRAYQRATRADGELSAQRNFAEARIRRLRAEILLDCVSQVTETKDKFQGLPRGAHAVQIADGTTTNYFLTTFGRSPRETVCACEVRTEPTLSQALHLINGDTVEQKIAAGGVISRMLAEKKTPAAILRALYTRCYGREPSADELRRLLGLVARQKSKAQALGDVFWAILNSREFVFNH